MEYDVVFSCDLEDFVAHVKKRIGDGFSPLGGISHSVDSEGQTYLYQAMTRPKQNKYVTQAHYEAIQRGEMPDPNTTPLMGD